MSTQFQPSGGQLAPVPPPEDVQQLRQERREEQNAAPKLTLYLNKTLDAIATLDPSENLKIHNTQNRCVAYYDERWDGYARNGEWVDNPTVDGEITPKDNEYKRQIDKLLMEMSRSRIDQECTAVKKSSATAREAAEFAQRRVQINQERIETEPFLQSENMSLLLKMMTFRYSFFDRTAESPEQGIELQVLKQFTGQDQSVTVCRTCGMTVQREREQAAETAETIRDLDRAQVKANEALGTNCPNCGDTETREIAVGPTESLDVQQQKKSAGRVVTVRPDATMVQLDLNARDVPSSSFVKWRLVMRRCDWEAMYPNTRIPSSDESQESRHRSESQNTASNSGWDSSSSDVGGGDQFEKIEGELVWLDPKVYARYQNREDERLKGGQILPAGTKFVEQFPEGVCVARIGKTVLDLYPSNKNKCWTMCVYGLREHALHGSGTTALLGPQDTINDLNAFITAHAYYSAAGREFVRSGAVRGGDLPPYNKVGIIEQAPDDRDIVGWAYGRSQPSGLAPDVYQFREAQRGSLQDAAGTSSLSAQGAADQKILGTATGVEASRDQAVGRMIPNRKLQAYMGSEWARQVLQLERENYSPEVFLESAGKGNEKGEVEFTERGVKAFFNMNVTTELSIKPADGSWVPTTPAQEKANATEFGGIAAKVQNEEILSLLAPKYGIDYSVNEFGAAQRNASLRLEEYARVSEIIEQGGYDPSPEMVRVVIANCAEWARVDLIIDKHAAYRDYYADWMTSDEGRNAAVLLRMVVRRVFELHGAGTAEQGKEITAIQIAAQEPARVVQQQEQAKAEEAAVAASEEAKADQVVQSIGQQMLTERDREHQAETEVMKQAAMNQAGEVSE